MFSYTRTLHPDDYPLLNPYADDLRFFEKKLMGLGVPFRKDHDHRLWEYALACKALAEVVQQGRQAADVRVLDTGSGCCYLPLYLHWRGYDVDVNDSCAYGDVRELFARQLAGMGTTMRLNTDPVEALVGFAPETFDFTMCVSVIEHVASDQYRQALRELWRVTKPGGYLYLTSDLFPDWARWEVSPFKQIQHNVFTPENALGSVQDAIRVVPVGVMDPFVYRGDFVHNYSFLSMLWQKPSA